MKITDFRIEQTFQRKIPPLTTEELQQLEANILEEGRVLTPIVIWNNTIIDGHNRYKLLCLHPEIKFSVHKKDFANEHEAIV